MNNFFLYETADGKQVNERATLEIKTVFGSQMETFVTESGERYHPNYVRFEKVGK